MERLFTSMRIPIQVRLFSLMRNRIRHFTSMRIRLFIKVRRICNHWHTDLPLLHCEPSWLHCEPLWLHCEPPLLHYEPPWLHCKPPLLHCETPWLPSFDFCAYLDPDFDFDADQTFDFNADPEPASQNDVYRIYADCRSGSRSATLMKAITFCMGDRREYLKGDLGKKVGDDRAM
jgi:hypothetical protein